MTATQQVSDDEGEFAVRPFEGGQDAAPTGMRAQAHVATTLGTSAGRDRSRVSTLRSEAPLVLRLTLPKGPEPWSATQPDVPRVCLAAGAAGPIGGDRLGLRVEVGPGSALVLGEVSPTLLLPGPHGEQSRTAVRIRVGARGTLIWLPEPMIAARGCDHVNDVRVELDDGARFLMREELLLGRHGEPTGTVRLRVRVRLGGRPLYSQDLAVGTLGADSPAIVGRRRAVGSVLVVDPDWADGARSAELLAGDAALLPLTGPAALVTAVSSDNLDLRRQLESGLTALGPPWDPRPASTS